MNFNAYAEGKENLNGVALVSAGHIFAKPKREIFRPNGRNDWLLLYIARESETFYLDKVQTGKQGSFIIFAPGEKQHHIYDGDKTAEFYYVHFCCERLDTSLVTSTLYNLPLSRRICDTFEEIIEEILHKRPMYEKVSLCRFFNILYTLEREVKCDTHPDKENFERIAKAISHMNKFYDSHFSLDDYARLCNMSKFHFIRVFEKISGTSPLEYKNNIRMQHALELLLEKRLIVEEISQKVGFSSASYFSQSFKKKYGVSPKQYQQKNT